MELRPYQTEAVAAIMHELSTLPTGNAVVCLPTGSGKSLVLAEVARRMAHPLLILQPSREILSQNLDKLLCYVPRDQVGVYSASMNEKTLGHITLATIQSIYTKPELFAHIGLVLIDECHLLNPRDTGTMFRSFLDAIGKPKVIGLTASPWRMDTMYVMSNDVFAGQRLERATTTKVITRMKGLFWNRFIYVKNVADLVNDRYLCPMKYYNNSNIKHSDLPTNKSKSDFDLDAYEALIGKEEEKVLDAIRRAQECSMSVLVFCASVAQAERWASVVRGSAVVSAKTKPKERERIIREFKDGTIKTVFNMGVLTTGFDHPALDCIVLARPTKSIALYYQMLGRGLRIAPGKDHCKVIDFTGTVRELGRVETIRLVKRAKWELESEKGSWHLRVLYQTPVQ